MGLAALSYMYKTHEIWDNYTTMKNKVKTLTKWKKELDAIFSLYIRIRDDGQCYTCPKKDEIKKVQNGHFVPRQYLKTRWDERNCHCQCYACNMLYNGQPSLYAVRLRQQYGDTIIEDLEKNRMIPVKLDAIWYQEKINHYHNEVSHLQETK